MRFQSKLPEWGKHSKENGEDVPPNRSLLASLPGSPAITGAPITMDATSESNAEAGKVGIDLSGVNIASASAQAEAGGSNPGRREGGGVTVSASALTMNATSENTASADTILISVAGISVDIADPVAKTSHNTEVYIGPAGTLVGDAALVGAITAGTVTGHATSTNNASVDDFALKIGGVTVEVVQPDVSTSGTTRAHLGGKFTITAGSVTFTANATNTATAEAINIEISGAGLSVAPKSARPPMIPRHTLARKPT